MIDQVLGRPSGGWKRIQTLLVMIFWIVSLRWRNGPYFLRRLGKPLTRYTPWQISVAVSMSIYALKNLNAIVGLASPEPLARLYSRDYFRATWIAMALDAGFATAMPIQRKWLRDISSIAFSFYYLIFANEADEKMRKFRALSQVEMLRCTWEKQANPYIRFATSFDRPKVPTIKKFTLRRPADSPYSKPISAVLYYNGRSGTLADCKNLILDFPGGGFICMSPIHHEERILRWAHQTNMPILSINYEKAPEHPYPYAIHEGLDVYRLLVESKGAVLGFGQGEINIVMTGDSAGANLATAVVIKLLELPAAAKLPLPVGLVYAYPALDFNYGSWMSPSSIAVLKQAESTVNLKGITEQKDHFSHRSPLALIDDKQPRRKRTKSWSKSFSKLPLIGGSHSRGSSVNRPRSEPDSDATSRRTRAQTPGWAKSFPKFPVIGIEPPKDSFDEDSDDLEPMRDEDRSIESRVQYWDMPGVEDTPEHYNEKTKVETTHHETRLTMTSRSACFNDRILSAPMMRSMALCYIGPRNTPDISTNYYISPILVPSHLLAQFPPVYLICGEKDPLSDDTIILAGRLREAKLARKAELKEKAKTDPSVAQDPILEETERDWCHLKILAGWSHGFLQMVTILRAAEQPISLMGSWIQHAFAREVRMRELFELKKANGNSAWLPEDKEGEEEDQLLTFATRKRQGSQLRVPSPSPITSGSSSTSTLLTTPDQVSPTLQKVALVSPSVSTTMGRRGSGGAIFVDENDILRRRRQEAMADLGAPRPHNSM